MAHTIIASQSLRCRVWIVNKSRCVIVTRPKCHTLSAICLLFSFLGVSFFQRMKTVTKVHFCIRKLTYGGTAKPVYVLVVKWINQYVKQWAFCTAAPLCRRVECGTSQLNWNWSRESEHVCAKSTSNVYVNFGRRSQCRFTAPERLSGRNELLFSSIFIFVAIRWRGPFVRFRAFKSMLFKSIDFNYINVCCVPTTK